MTVAERDFWELGQRSRRVCRPGGTNRFRSPGEARATEARRAWEPARPLLHRAGET